MYQDLKGIGQAVAIRFGQEQMNVVVNDKGDEDGTKKDCPSHSAARGPRYMRMFPKRKEFER